MCQDGHKGNAESLHQGQQLLLKWNHGPVNQAMAATEHIMISACTSIPQKLCYRKNKSF